MTATRWSLPAPPLRTSVLVTAVVGVAAVEAVALAATAPLGLGSVYAIKAGAVFAGVMTAALAFMRRDHPFPGFGAANRVTTGRAACVALIAACIGEAHGAALAVAVAATAGVATASDGLDGWLARRSGQASAFGARFDMEVDALLIMALSALAWRWDKAGAWVLWCGLMRYAFVAAGLALPWVERPLPPSFRRKAICVVQIVGLIAVVTPFLHRPLTTLIAATTLVVLAYSFLADVAWLWRHERPA